MKLIQPKETKKKKQFKYDLYLTIVTSGPRIFYPWFLLVVPLMWNVSFELCAAVFARIILTYLYYNSIREDW